MDPDGRSSRDKITEAVNNNLGFTSTDSMACDVFITKVLNDAGVKPNDWPNLLSTTVVGYKSYYQKDLKTIVSSGWNVVIMRSEYPTMEINGVEVITDPTAHMGLMYKDEETNELTLVHYTHGSVVVQKFKNEVDFKEKMPYEVYRYDTAEYKAIE